MRSLDRMAKELGARKIRVNSLNPGLVETEGTGAMGISSSENDFRKQYEATRRLGGSASRRISRRRRFSLRRRIRAGLRGRRCMCRADRGKAIFNREAKRGDEAAFLNKFSTATSGRVVGDLAVGDLFAGAPRQRHGVQRTESAASRSFDLAVRSLNIVRCKFVHFSRRMRKLSLPFGGIANLSVRLMILTRTFTGKWRCGRICFLSGSSMIKLSRPSWRGTRGIAAG